MNLEIENDGDNYVVKCGARMLATFSRIEWSGLVALEMAEAFRKGYEMGHLEGYGRGIENLVDDGR